MTLRLLLGTVTALAFHLMFGWAWSVAGGVVAGIFGLQEGMAPLEELLWDCPGGYFLHMHS